MLSKCGQCGGGIFEIVEVAPHKSAYKLLFVQCTACGVPIGAMEYFNSGAILKGIEKDLKQLKSEMTNGFSEVDRKIRQLGR